MKGQEQRSEAGVLSGSTPLKYRYVFEVDPPLPTRKKQADGSKTISRLEFFGDSEDMFYVMVAAISRLIPGGLKRGEAVILDESQHPVAVWVDKNPNEAN